MSIVIPVSLAFITNADKHVLMTQRAKDSDMAGYWEFPGGKIEAQETPEEALKRELFEELGISIDSPRFIKTLRHDYPHRTVLLYVYHVTNYTGRIHCCEKQQAMRWVAVEDIAQYRLLEAGFRLISDLASVVDVEYEPEDDF
jgi:8-oxo-dGTP diphosphatase